MPEMGAYERDLLRSGSRWWWHFRSKLMQGLSVASGYHLANFEVGNLSNVCEVVQKDLLYAEPVSQDDLTRNAYASVSHKGDSRMNDGLKGYIFSSSKIGQKTSRVWSWYFRSMWRLYALLSKMLNVHALLLDTQWELWLAIYVRMSTYRWQHNR